MGLINAVVITSVNLSSTRVGTVVLSHGAYLIVVAIAVRSRNSKMTNINSDINFNKVLLYVHWKHCWHGIRKQRNRHSSSSSRWCFTNRNNRNNNPEAPG